MEKSLSKKTTNIQPIRIHIGRRFQRIPIIPLNKLNKITAFHYPKVLMPRQQTGYIKGKKNDCL
jgi:hypothetical protein